MTLHVPNILWMWNYNKLCSSHNYYKHKINVCINYSNERDHNIIIVMTVLDADNIIY